MIFDLSMLILVICGVIVALFILDKGYDLVMWIRYEWRRVNLGTYRASRNLWEK